MIRKEIRDAISSQITTEIQFARRYKQGKVTNWQKNEQMYYGKKEKTEDARANVGLGRMQEFVHTILSKVDNPLTFVFTKRKDSQLKRTQLLNQLRAYDAYRDNWDMKDLVGKKQAIIYGRAIFSYAASSEDGYMPHLDNVDVYDFLVDPSAGGLDIERGKFMGRYGVVKDRSELKNNPDYIKSEVKNLLDGSGNSTEETQEVQNKRNRMLLQQTVEGTKEISDTDKFVFWEWYTTYKGERYYALVNENGCIIRLEKLVDIFASNLWPFWTYACFPDLTEFWSTSYCDYAREIFMAQEVSINQMLDNAEQINKPVKYVDTMAIENLAELKYSRNKLIRLKAGVDGNKAVRVQETPSIRTPIEVFQILDQINDRASGVTPGTAGLADTDGRATIYEGNQANAADRFGLFNKTYAFGYQRFGRLYEHGVQEHLMKPVAVDIIGPEGMEVKKISRRDIFRKGDEFGLMTESSNAELAMSEQKRRVQVAFLSALFNNTNVNQKELISILSSKAQVDPEELRRLLDVDNQGTAEVLSEAARDTESILDGEIIEPNRVADTAYMEYMVNYSQDHMEDMNPEQRMAMVNYIESIQDVVVENMARKAQKEGRLQAQAELGGGTGTPSRMRAPGPAQPLQDVIQQNVQN